MTTYKNNNINQQSQDYYSLQRFDDDNISHHVIITIYDDDIYNYDYENDNYEYNILPLTRQDLYKKVESKNNIINQTVKLFFDVISFYISYKDKEQDYSVSSSSIPICDIV